MYLGTLKVVFAIIELLVILEIWSILDEVEAATKWSSGDEEGQDEQQRRTKSATTHIGRRVRRVEWPQEWLSSTI